MTAVDAVDSARIELIRAALTEAFAPTRLLISDDSHRHIGHAGARDGRGHFSVEIVSVAFAGMPALARHREGLHPEQDPGHVHARARQRTAVE